MNEPPLYAEDVDASYGWNVFGAPDLALDNFSLEVPEGSITGLVGPNGSGKSTAVYCFLGLLRPLSGKVTLFGEAPERGSSSFRDVAYLPEEAHYHNFLTVRELLDYYSGLNHETVEETQYNQLFDLEEYLGKRLTNCSKGIRQQVGITACELADPRLIILDEPTRGLDPMATDTVLGWCKSRNENGGTILINSHVMSDIERVCGRVAFIKDGAVLEVDQLENLLSVKELRYDVEVGPDAKVPGVAENIRESDHSTVFEVPAERIEEVFDHARRTENPVIKCGLKRSNLRDVFQENVSENS